MEKIELTPEEQKAEQEALKEAKEDDIRTQVITDYGFDEEDDSERIDKLVEKEMGYKKSLSQAIGQKIKKREELELRDKEIEDLKKLSKEPKEESKDSDFDKKLSKAFEERDLDSMEYPDELKAEIQKLAKLQEVSVKKAAQDKYIISKIDEWKKEQETDEASIGRKDKSSGKAVYSKDSPPEVNMNTKEGREEWDKYTDWLRTQY